MARSEDRTRTARSKDTTRTARSERAVRSKDRTRPRTRGLWGSTNSLLAWKQGNKLQLQSITLSTTGYLHSSSPYHHRGAPIFPKPPTKKTYKQGNCCKARKQVVPHSGIEGKSDNGRANPPPPALSHLNMVVVAFLGFESIKVWFRQG